MTAPATQFRGVFPILVTPFHEDESLDLASLKKLVRFMAQAGVNGVTVLGVLGEPTRLSESERYAVLETALEAAEGRLPVIVGLPAGGTAAALLFGRQAEDKGASGLLVAPLKEPVPNEQRILEYYQRLAGAISIPICLQDHPESTAVHLPAELILRLVKEVPRIASIKVEAAPTPAKIQALQEGLAERPVTLLAGLGALYGFFELERKADGFMTGFAFPEILRAMLEAVHAGKHDHAFELYRQFLRSSYSNSSPEWPCARNSCACAACLPQTACVIPARRRIRHRPNNSPRY